MIRVAFMAFLLAAAIGYITGSHTVGVIAFFGLFFLLAVGNAGKLKCPACHKRVKLNASRCHHCGQDVTPTVAS